MRVEVRLYATFARYAPGKSAGDPVDVDLPAPATVQDLISHLGIPAREVHLVIVNAQFTHDRMHPLREGDRIALFPPVGGG